MKSEKYINVTILLEYSIKINGFYTCSVTRERGSGTPSLMKLTNLDFSKIPGEYCIAVC